MARFDAEIEMAKLMIAENGEDVIWRSIEDPAAIDPQEPWKPGPSTSTDYPVFICFLPANRTNLESLNLMDKTEVPQGAALGYMGVVEFKPNIKDVVIRGGETLRIAYIDRLSPNGQNILYTMLFCT